MASLMSKMQISVVGKERNDSDSGMDASEPEDDSSGDEDALNVTTTQDAPSKKHARLTDLQERAEEDLDFPDEVDTPLENARIRF